MSQEDAAAACQSMRLKPVLSDVLCKTGLLFQTPSPTVIPGGTTGIYQNQEGYSRRNPEMRISSAPRKVTKFAGASEHFLWCLLRARVCPY